MDTPESGFSCFSRVREHNAWVRVGRGFPTRGAALQAAIAFRDAHLGGRAELWVGRDDERPSNTADHRRNRPDSFSAG